jgi:glucose/arabinose dehydrogenase
MASGGETVGRLRGLVMRERQAPGRRARRSWAVVAGLAAAVLTAGSAAAGPILPETSRTAPAVVGGPQIALQLKASGLSSPVFVTSARDGTGRLFIVEKTGRIRIFKDGKVRSTPFLSLAGKVSTGSEQGLLGLAFHPNFETNRKLYVSFTNRHGNSVVREYKASKTNRNVVNTSTKRNILKVSQPFANHNGGMIAFGPDGYLYVGLGDGGSGGDPGNRAQRLDTLLGKILRIDVNGSANGKHYRIPPTNPFAGPTPGYDEIWQSGVRNPWRFSFDRATGDLWIGDVGQNEWEEVDRAVRSGGAAGPGVNWGWRVLEGTHCYNPSSGCNPSGKTAPLTEYSHGSGRCSITGGYVYRGSAISSLKGWYVFGDYCSGEIWAVPANASAPAAATPLLDTSRLISSFGENASGELFVVDLGGRLYRVVPG